MGRQLPVPPQAAAQSTSPWSGCVFWVWVLLLLDNPGALQVLVEGGHEHLNGTVR